MSEDRTRRPAHTVVQVRAGPFASFRDAVAFQRRIASLPDVRGVEVRTFVGGTVLLHVRYAGAFPLPTVLAVQDEHLEVWIVSPTQIDVRVRPKR